MILLPLILHSHANVSWFQFRFFEAVKTHLYDDEENPSLMRSVIKAFGLLAHCNTLVDSQQYIKPKDLNG